VLVTLTICSRAVSLAGKLFYGHILRSSIVFILKCSMSVAWNDLVIYKVYQVSLVHTAV